MPQRKTSIKDLKKNRNHQMHNLDIKTDLKKTIKAFPHSIHQTFQGRNFVICSFVPRLYDYHPDAIPAPYHHSNVDSDELLYYVDGDFMSRNNIEKGQFTLHPGGLPHGPHPGAIERSIGQKETKELAVMIDPFNPVMITEDAMNMEHADYYQSWLLQK